MLFIWHRHCRCDEAGDLREGVYARLYGWALNPTLSVYEKEAEGDFREGHVTEAARRDNEPKNAATTRCWTRQGRILL